MDYEPTIEDLEQIASISPRELEPLYWVLEDALYDNRLARAKAAYGIFCALAKTNRCLFFEGLRKRQVERLKEIAFELFDQEICQKRRVVDFKLPTSPKALPFKNEKELEIFLSNNLIVLELAIGDHLRLVGTQVETDFGYACDIVAEGKKFYPIELKIGQSTHAAVSQIEKYCFYFYRKLRYDRYKPIQGVVVANGFCAYSVNALRKNGHRVFDIIPDEQVVHLREIL